jgi:hypothetical protein
MNKIYETLKNADGKYTKELFQQLDKELSFGVNACTSKGKDIYTSEKAVSVKVNIKSAKTKSYDVTQRKGFLSLQMNSHVKLAISSSEDNSCCIQSGNGFKCMNIKDLDTEVYYIIEHKGTDIEEEFKRRIKGMTEICEKFGINAEKCCYAPTIVCRNIAFNNLKYLLGAQHVSQTEAKWVDGACRGALQFADKGRVIEGCYDYDINSMYPYLMSSETFEFPIKQGIEVPINEKHKGVLEIMKLNIKGKHKYWVNTYDNYYTTYHIRLLKYLKIPYETVGETKLVYKDNVRGDDIFGYMSDIFDLKAKGNKYAKDVMNCTWGSLSKKKDFTISLDKIRDDQWDKVKQIVVEKGYAIIEDERPYKHATGRMKIFLLSYARYYFVRSILTPLEETGRKVYQVNTDGFITDATEEEVEKIYPIGKAMGELKVKVLKGKYKVHHVTKVICE